MIPTRQQLEQLERLAQDASKKAELLERMRRPTLKDRRNAYLIEYLEAKQRSDERHAEDMAELKRLKIQQEATMTEAIRKLDQELAQAHTEKQEAWRSFQDAQRDYRGGYHSRSLKSIKQQMIAESDGKRWSEKTGLSDEDIRARARDPKYWGNLYRAELYKFPVGQEAEYVAAIDAIPVEKLREIVQEKPRALPEW